MACILTQRVSDDGEGTWIALESPLLVKDLNFKL